LFSDAKFGTLYRGNDGSMSTPFALRLNLLGEELSMPIVLSLLWLILVGPAL
jgi:hypothetical protein